MAQLLLLDNDPRLLELFAAYLTRRGHVVRCARSFVEARARIAEARPELLLSDLELGAERGEEELERLAREQLLPPTLIVSGYLDPRLATRLEQLPEVLGLVSKPFALDALEARISAAVERGRALTSAASRTHVARAASEAHEAGA